MIVAPGQVWGRWRPLVVVAAIGGLIAVLLTGAIRSRGASYEPDSTDPFGTKALVLLLESFGAEVEVVSGVPPADAEIALMLSNVITPTREAAVLEWVERGGRLVVADPYSPLTPPVAERASLFGGASEVVERDACRIPALAQLQELVPGSSYARYEVTERALGCFDDGNGAFVVADQRGDGWLVFVGGADLFTNSLLAVSDNAGLAVALLAPREGTRVVILDPRGGVPSDRSLFDAVPRGFWLALTQLVVAFGVYSWFRGRRLGPVMVEPQPVQIEGSELVSAVGSLAQLSRRPERTAAVLRRALHRELVSWLGLPSDVSPQALAEVAASRTGVDRDRVLSALAGPAVTGDVELVALADEIERIRKEVMHAR